MKVRRGGGRRKGQEGQDKSTQRRLKSSEVNPSCSIHRGAAKLQWTKAVSVDQQLPVIASGVTKASLSQEDRQSIAETEYSQFSSFTNCTNPTFDVVHRTWKSGSNLQKDILSVLAAVTELIHEKGGKESETEYFAALLTALEGTSPKNGNQLGATAYLLNLVMKKIPDNILAAKFSTASKIIYTSLGNIAATKMQQGDDNQQGSSSMHLACSALRVQPSSTWSDPSVVRMLNSLLTFATSEHPRVRKAVRSGSQILLNNSVSMMSSSKNGAESIHPAAKLVAEFVVNQLEEYDLNSGKGGVCVQQCLDLVSVLMHRIPAISFKTLTETILKLVSTDKIDCGVRESAFECLIQAFVHAPNDSTCPASLNLQIVHALFDFKPSADDPALLNIWCRLICEAYVCLGSKDAKLLASTSNDGSQLLPRLFTELFKLMDNDVLMELHGVRVMVRLIQMSMSELLPIAQLTEIQQTMNKTLDIVAKPLSIPSAIDLWSPSLKIIACFFSTIGSHCADLDSFSTVLTTLVDLRESPTAENRQLCALLEGSISSAIRYVGLSRVLSVVELGIESSSAGIVSGNLELPRSWLLPLIRKAMDKVSLEFFINRFLPIAMNINKSMKMWKEAGKKAEVHVYGLLERQLWDLFPVFCQTSVDIEESFDKVAKVVGMLIVQRPILRLPLLKGLRIVANYVSSIEDIPDRTRMTQRIGRFAKNYIPILFNLYSTIDDSNPESRVDEGYDRKGVQAAALSTMKCWVVLDNSVNVSSYLETALNRVNIQQNSTNGESDDEEGEDKAENILVGKKKKKSSTSLLILDIIVSLIPSLQLDSLQRLSHRIWPWLNSNNILQKKAYRILQECSKNSQEFVEENIDQLENLFDSVYKNSAIDASRALRISCLLRVLEVKQTNEAKIQDEFIDSLFTEIVFSLANEKSTKLRTVATKGLTKLMRIWISSMSSSSPAEEEDDGNNTRQVVSFVIDKLSTHQLEASIVVAKRIILHQYGNQMNADILSTMIRELSRGLADQRHKVVEQSLYLLKKLLIILPSVSLQLYRDILLTAFFGQEPDVRRGLRRVNELLLRTFIQKIGLPCLEKAAPLDWQPQLKNVRKRLVRKERKSLNPSSEKDVDENEMDDEDDRGSAWTLATGKDTIADLLAESSDEENEPLPDDSKRSRGKKSIAPTRFSKKMPVWLEEGDEDEIVDLLSQKLSSQMVAVNPRTKSLAAASKKRDDNRGFSIAKDGRFILAPDDSVPVPGALAKEPDDLEGIKLGKRGQRKKMDADDDDNDSEMNKGGRRKKVRFDFDDDDGVGVESDEELYGQKYKAGGVGIHRPLNGPSGNQPTKSKGQKGDARKKGQKFEPYSYTPLDFKTLNKRKQAKFAGRFKNLVKGAQSGAAKGVKKRKK